MQRKLPLRSPALDRRRGVAACPDGTMWQEIFAMNTTEMARKIAPAILEVDADPTDVADAAMLVLSNLIHAKGGNRAEGIKQQTAVSAPHSKFAASVAQIAAAQRVRTGD